MSGDLSTDDQGQSALKQLKELLPNPNDESKVPNETIAKLHAPDLLPKHLWKQAIESVDIQSQFGMPYLKLFTKLLFYNICHIHNITSNQYQLNLPFAKWLKQPKYLIMVTIITG